MKKLLVFFICLVFTSAVFGQDSKKSKAEEEIPVTFGTYYEQNEFDFYHADAGGDTLLPLCIFVHGGGFSGGDRGGPLHVNFCQSLASLGYHAASISYPLLQKDQGFGCDVSESRKTLQLSSRGSAY